MLVDSFKLTLLFVAGWVNFAWIPSNSNYTAASSVHMIKEIQEKFFLHLDSCRQASGRFTIEVNKEHDLQRLPTPLAEEH